MKLCDVVEPHGLVCAGALSDTATTMVLVSTILLRMTCTMLSLSFVALPQHSQAPQQQHCPQRSPRLLRTFHGMSEHGVHVAILVALFERMLRCCMNILIIIS